MISRLSLRLRVQRLLLSNFVIFIDKYTNNEEQVCKYELVLSALFLFSYLAQNDFDCA